MSRISTVFVALFGVVFLTPTVWADEPYTRDTVRNRQNTVIGTPKNENAGTIIIRKDGSVITTTPREKPEPVDWYDKIIISVSPDVNYPEKQTSTTTVYDNATDSQKTTTTTTGPSE